MVTIRQNNSVIYQTSVPPGEFEISDLYPTSYSGDLQVTVEEADGEQTYIFPNLLCSPHDATSWELKNIVSTWGNIMLIAQSENRPFTSFCHLRLTL